MNAPMLPLTARFTPDQHKYIKNHKKKSVLLRELLNAYMQKSVKS